MKSLQWDIFCKVIDNFGDIGIGWRLSADLAARGQRVRLWVDDVSALSWMAPAGCEGVHVLAWTESIDVSILDSSPCEVLLEAFGCEIAPEFLAACTRFHASGGQKGLPNQANLPVWINLEYLSAEPYVARNHGLTSLVSSGPAAGWHKVFYYPGFTPDTGGLLREPDLWQRQAVFDRTAWLKQQGVICQADKAEVLVSLFCYEPPALALWLRDVAQHGIDGKPVHLLVAAGRANQAVKEVVENIAEEALKADKTPKKTPQIGLQTNGYKREQLSISYLPELTQFDFDHLLWASDINFVRGEDSMVRAIWAGKPFVWQLYPQEDGAHGPKLDAFLDMLGAPAPLQAFHRAWNGTAGATLTPLPELPAWQQTASKATARLAQQQSLTTGLLKYAAKTR